MSTEETPLVFANRLIKQLVSNLFIENLEILPKDYVVIRVAFRGAGGSWEKLWYGDPAEVDRLKSIIQVWAKQPDRVDLSKRVV
jgi:hypothetical protein